jgi:hypothetical protein
MAEGSMQLSMAVHNAYVASLWISLVECQMCGQICPRETFHDAISKVPFHSSSCQIC